MSQSENDSNGANPPPPKLLRASTMPIPILKIEKLKSDKSGEYSSKRVEACQDIDSALDSSPPPKLDKFMEDDNDNISVASSSTRGNNSDAVEGNSSSDKRRKNVNDPKKIIQSIFAKPKKGKPKKRKTSKPKKSSKPPAAPQYLRIKIRSASARRQQQQQNESENGDDMEIEADDVEDNKGSEESEDQKVSKKNKKSNRNDSDEDDEDTDMTDSQQTVGDNNCKKSEEDEDMFDDGQEWKPVRAAMVAAMELVAKKQVTDDMRVDRRVRKHILKPLPPKGRGRRAIFKRLNKPVKSCEETAGPFVHSSAYYDHTYFQNGDIVYLISDLRGKELPNLKYHRFFQINGFLKIPVGQHCASLSLLQRVVPLPELPDKPLFVLPRDMKPEEEEQKEDKEEEEEEEYPYPFKLIEYRPAGCRDYMVPMSNLKFVMHAPPDFYYGHDVLFHKPFGGRVYSRLGNDLYDYKETRLDQVDIEKGTQAQAKENNQDDGRTEDDEEQDLKVVALDDHEIQRTVQGQRKKEGSKNDECSQKSTSSTNNEDDNVSNSSGSSISASTSVSNKSANVL